jgi:asparagine synthetase B (glutamine-hydrolysing)
MSRRSPFPPFHRDEALDEVAGEWRRLLLATLDEYARGLPILLSGGVDSGTLLAGLLELGERPECYAFRLSGTRCVDFEVAQKMASDHELRFEPVVIEQTEEELVRDIRRVIELLGWSGKAIVQCSQPIMRMADRIVADGATGAIVGTGAVCLDDRKVNMLAHYDGEEVARDYRRAKLDDKNRECGTGGMHRIASLVGAPLVEPFSEEPVVSFALALDFRPGSRERSLNWPRQKGIALRAFPTFWGLGYYRTNSPLQVNSGIREWHDTLLASELNTRGARGVVAIYNDIRKEIHGR